MKETHTREELEDARVELLAELERADVDAERAGALAGRVAFLVLRLYPRGAGHWDDYFPRLADIARENSADPRHALVKYGRFVAELVQNLDRRRVRAELLRRALDERGSRPQ